MAKPKKKMQNPGDNLQQNELDDREEQAVPSGEPKVVGRSHGWIINDDGEPAGLQGSTPPPDANEPDSGEDWESGRHHAME